MIYGAGFAVLAISFIAFIALAVREDLKGEKSSSRHVVSPLRYLYRLYFKYLKYTLFSQIFQAFKMSQNVRKCKG